jgi:tetratricopeptide (TPR) repeat protein
MVMKRHKKKLLIISVFCLMWNGALASAQEDLSRVQAKELFLKGNMSYQEGKYSEAIEQYQRIVKGGKHSGALYYNIGNTYFKRGEIGKAILNYERAHLFIPRDHDLRANHRFALSQIQIADNERTKSFYEFIKEGIAGCLTVNEILVGIYLLVVLAGMVHLLALYLSWSKKQSHYIIFFLGLIIIISLGECIGRISRLDDLGVVTTRGQAQFEPREEATIHFALNEGEKVAILKEVGVWSKIKRQDEKAGWVKSEKIERVLWF